MWLYHRVMSPNDADGMANSIDPDQTAPLGTVWSGSALFAQTCLSENLGKLRYTKFWVEKSGFFSVLLTACWSHQCLLSHNKDLDKQHRPISDVKESSIWSGPTLFVLKKEKNSVKKKMIKLKLNTPLSTASKPSSSSPKSMGCYECKCRRETCVCYERAGPEIDF